MGINDVKVSFIVTYYNQKKYVKESIESILKIKKEFEWDIVVGDDGSNDGTIEEVNEYICKYPQNIRLYVMPREEGKKYDSVKRASANRLNALEHAEGQFFCILDGDDYYSDTQFVVDAINEFVLDEKISVVMFGYKYLSSGVYSDSIVLPRKVLPGRIDKSMYINSYYTHAGACVFRKHTDVKRIEYIRKLGYYDDNDIVINNLNYGDIYYINRAIYVYRQTGNSVYTSMNKLEQAVLNVQGLDVDLKLIEKKYGENLISRNAVSIILMYIWKKRLIKVLGNEKINKYKQGCESLLPSLCLGLLEYNILSKEQKKEINRVYRFAKKNNRKYLYKERIKFIMRREL